MSIVIYSVGQYTIISKTYRDVYMYLLFKIFFANFFWSSELRRGKTEVRSFTARWLYRFLVSAKKAFLNHMLIVLSLFRTAK